MNIRLTKKLTFVLLSLMLTVFVGQVYASKPPVRASYATDVNLNKWTEKEVPFTIIDVREPEEFRKGHLDDAVNIPYYQIEEKMAEFDKNMRYLIYGQTSSWRAPYAANTLKDMQFTHPYIYKGGYLGTKGQPAVKEGEKPKIVFATYEKDNESKQLKHPKDMRYRNQISFTRDKLRYYDGLDGRPAFVAIDGKVYDITQSRLWRGGEHDPALKNSAVKAGGDLTEQIKECPHGDELIRNFPLVGKLVD